MSAILAEFLSQELERARADENGRACELCRTREGVRFFDHCWTCEKCFWRLVLTLRLEQARTTPAFVLQRNDRREREI